MSACRGGIPLVLPWRPVPELQKATPPCCLRPLAIAPFCTKIDRNGRVIDLEKNKGKLHIIEQEFKAAERIEFWRQKEEEEMRVSNLETSPPPRSLSPFYDWPACALRRLARLTQLTASNNLSFLPQYRVQQKRHAHLSGREARQPKMKEDRLIRRDNVAATRESYGIKYPSIDDKWVATRTLGRLRPRRTAFFITDRTRRLFEADFFTALIESRVGGAHILDASCANQKPPALPKGPAIP